MGLYRTNKNAKTGTEIECPVCHTKFKKRQYSQAFCCTRCKDKYHNRHDGDRHSSSWYYKRALSSHTSSIFDTEYDCDYDDRDEVSDGLHM